MAEQLPSHLSASDSLMLEIERDPVLRSPILVLALLDRDPEWARVRSTFERATVRFPRLRQVIEPPDRPFGPHRWVDDEAFSLDFHLRRVRAPHPGDLRSVLDIAQPAATEALDPARPLWRATLVDGVEGGRAALLLQFHHTLTDGVGGLDIAREIFDADRHGTAVVHDAEGGAPAGRSAVDRVVGLARGGIDAATHPLQSAHTALRVARSVGRMLEPAPAALSPLFVGRGLDRHLDVLEVPFAELRAVADGFGCTINDVFLAAVGGALHDLHEREGHEVRALRVTMPISVRAEGDAAGGNQFTPARFVLPIDDPDARNRAHIAGAIAHRWQHEPAVGLTSILAGLLEQLPASLVTRIFGSMLRNVDVDVVDLAGLREPAYLGGARIERMWAFAPPTGTALSITLLTHLDTACVAVNADTTAVVDPELLLTCLEVGFEQVCSAPRHERVEVRS